MDIKIINLMIICLFLGGHVYECDECGETKISYNSCRNRHCPSVKLMLKKCGFMKEVNRYYQLITFILFLLYQNN